jgi:hypothetical protein
MLYYCNSCDTEFEVYCSGKVGFCPVCGDQDFEEAEQDEDEIDYDDELYGDDEES